MATIDEAIDQLRGRFVRCKGSVPFDTIAKEVKVSSMALKNFFHGRSVREQALRNIETWCEIQEAKQRAITSC